jgi:PAS domain S-box-containing protein
METNAGSPPASITDSARLQQIIDTLPTLTAYIDGNGVYRQINRTYESWVGFSRDQIIGRHIRAVLGETAWLTVRPCFEKALSGSEAEFEEIVPFAGAGERRVRAVYTPHRGERGVEGVTVAVTDITDQRRIEQELHEHQSRLAGIIDSAMDAIITVDSEQTIVVFNHAAERMFRCRSGEAIGSPLERFIPARYRGGHHAHVEDFGHTGVTTRAMAGARPVSGLRADGEEFPVEASISQIEVGPEKLFTVIMRDITERKRAEQAIQQQARLLDVSHDAIIVWRRPGGIEYWNSGARELYGYRRDEVIGRNIQDLLGTRFPVAWPEIEAILRAEGSWQGEVRHRTRAGRDLVVSVRLQSIAVRGDELVVLESARDVTEQRHAAEVLRESEARLNALFLNSPVAISIVDTDLRYVKANSLASRMIGRPVYDIIGQSAEEVHRSSSPGLPSRFRQILESGEAEYNIPMSATLAGPTSTTTYWLSSHFPIRSEEGRVLGVGSVAVDITQLRHAQEAIAVRDEVLRIVSHDIRTPVVAIGLVNKGLIGMLGESAKDAEMRENLELIARTVEQMNTLIGDLLDVTRIEAGKIELDRDRHSPGALVREAAELPGLLAAQKGVHLEIRAAEVLPAVEVDRRRLIQVLSNIIGNAVKFTPAGGRVTVQATMTSDGVQFSIVDTGPGIPVEHLRHIFDRFWQMQREDRGGTGLGLAIAKGYVEAHGGRIWAESTPGQGASFHFMVPMADSTPDFDSSQAPTSHKAHRR